MLNVDGCFKGNEKIGCDGIFLDNWRRWIGALCAANTSCMCLRSRLGLFSEVLNGHGIKGHHKITIQSDSKGAVKWINSTSVAVGLVQAIIEECKRWLQRDWTVEIRHIFQEKNQVADKLVSMAFNKREVWQELSVPSTRTCHLLHEDNLGNSKPKDN